MHGHAGCARLAHQRRPLRAVACDDDGRHDVAGGANEVLEALNQQEKFVLAIVRVDGDIVDGPHYIPTPFTKELEASVVSVNHSMKDLLKRAKPPHLA